MSKTPQKHFEQQNNQQNHKTRTNTPHPKACGSSRSIRCSRSLYSSQTTTPHPRQPTSTPPQQKGGPTQPPGTQEKDTPRTPHPPQPSDHPGNTFRNNHPP